MTPSLQDVWTWMVAKCNAAEIAAYTETTEQVALAMMEKARWKYLDGDFVIPLISERL